MHQNLIIPRSGKRHLRVQRKTELIADKKDLGSCFDYNCDFT